MARKTYDDIKTHCVICKDEVPKDRLMRGAITCTKEHAKLRRAQLQAITDKKDCRYCRRPSTPEEREAYKRFRKFEQKFSVEAATRLYRAALEVSNEAQESLRAGEKFDDIADTEVIEVSVSLLRELRDAIGDYER
jgi:hypothetical protein